MQPFGYGLKNTEPSSFSFPSCPFSVSSVAYLKKKKKKKANYGGTGGKGWGCACPFSENACVGVESIADGGLETNAVLSDELEEEGEVFVLVDEFCE